MTLTDKEYLEAVRKGNREDLYHIYEAFSPGIIRLVTRNGGSREDARDVFQTALTVIYERCRESRLELTGSFGGLLYGICRNIWGNQLQKKSFNEVSIPEDAKYEIEEDWNDRIVEEEKRKLLREKLSSLGEDCQKLLRLFFSGVSMEEIRQQLDLSSVGYTVKRKFICKERLVQLVKQDPRYRELKVQ